tara:strand:+ start:838 stop:1053 length:216 start_codon:yes stop_codon:yes gene_type:complete
MKRKKALTPTQEKLLADLKNHISTTVASPFDTLKNATDCKTFDSTFNALLIKGYVTRHETNDFTNQFKLTI